MSLSGYAKSIRDLRIRYECSEDGKKTFARILLLIHNVYLCINYL